MATQSSNSPQTPAADNDYTMMRRVMVESQLRPSDVNDPVVVSTMAITPRENFVPESRKATAYMDRAVPLDVGGRVLNPPLAAGLMLDRAEVRHDDNALVIGSGTGYLAALLAPLIASVVALEENEVLSEHAVSGFETVANITPITGELIKGYSAGKPYSLIIIDGAIEHLPEAIIRQLKDNGRLLTGIMEDNVTRLAIGHRKNDTFGLKPFIDSDIMPLPQFAASKSYSF